MKQPPKTDSVSISDADQATILGLEWLVEMEASSKLRGSRAEREAVLCRGALGRDLTFDDWIASCEAFPRYREVLPSLRATGATLENIRRFPRLARWHFDWAVFGHRDMDAPRDDSDEGIRREILHELYTVSRFRWELPPPVPSSERQRRVRFLGIELGILANKWMFARKGERKAIKDQAWRLISEVCFPPAQGGKLLYRRDEIPGLKRELSAAFTALKKGLRMCPPYRNDLQRREIITRLRQQFPFWPPDEWQDLILCDHSFRMRESPADLTITLIAHRFGKKPQTIRRACKSPT